MKKTLEEEKSTESSRINKKMGKRPNKENGYENLHNDNKLAVYIALKKRTRVHLHKNKNEGAF
ncbi:Protein CBG25615 [Caenorhabditis briggsae]|uniref:Protein CBG25615 n=1 Tax=Caenorhabditis briggsae TaxID=6238 RepID=B6IFA0_CAEBR|nr:Protein CBG25615 [Caenorhabditis briggsae]CAR98580.1 Protein CBG25615 [Caenorhabditis briggsae]